MPDSLEHRIRSEVRRSGVSREVVEKDYALSYVLAAMHELAALADQLVFKGGTALRKAHYGDYRFSEDLDFTALPGARHLEPLVTKAAARAEEALLTQGAFTVGTTRYPARDTHPDGQEAYRIQVRFPWHRMALCSVKVEITTDEPVLGGTTRLPLVHGYGESLACSLRCYTLEEVVAEKLRALLQTGAHLAARGWAPPRSRDYFDLWQILCVREGRVDAGEVASMLAPKCVVRGVTFECPDDFFAATVLERARIDWRAGLRRVVPDPPDFDDCIRDLRAPVGDLVRRSLSLAGVSVVTATPIDRDRRGDLGDEDR